MGASRFLYVAVHPNGLHKIGMTANPKSREKALCVDHKAKVEVLWSIECDSWDARSIEMIAHRMLAPLRAHGEWFAVTLDDAVATVRAAIVERYQPTSGAERERKLTAAKERHQDGEALSRLAFELRLTVRDLQLEWERQADRLALVRCSEWFQNGRDADVWPEFSRLERLGWLDWIARAEWRINDKGRAVLAQMEAA